MRCLVMLAVVVIALFFSVGVEWAQETSYSSDHNRIAKLIEQLGGPAGNEGPAKKELIVIGVPAVEPLIMVLKNDKRIAVRASAAEVLGTIKDERSIAPLIEILNNGDDPFVRSRIVVALGKFKDKNAIRPLILSVMRDSFVAEEAAYALGGYAWRAYLWFFLKWQIWVGMIFAVAFIRAFQSNISTLFKASINFTMNNINIVSAIFAVIVYGCSFYYFSSSLGEDPFSSFPSLTTLYVSVFITGGVFLYFLISWLIIIINQYVVFGVIFDKYNISLLIKYIPVLPAFICLSYYLNSVSFLILSLFWFVPQIICQIVICDILIGLIKTPWLRTRLLPQKNKWLCQHDYHRPIFKKLSPWLSRWTNRHILSEKIPCAEDFSDHWRCPACDRTDWLSGVSTVVGLIGGNLGQPIQNGDVLSLPLIGVDGRAVASDLDRIEVRSWPSGCHDVDVLNSVFIRLQYAARKPLKDVPIHLAPGVVLSDAGRDLAARHFGPVVAA